MPGFNIPFQFPGCPAGPDTRGQPSNTVETARKHRYLLEVLQPLGTRDNGILLFLEKCNRPSPEFDKMMVHSAQDELPRPGKIHWKEIEFTFYEKCDGVSLTSQSTGLIEDTCAKLIYQWWSAGMMNINTSLFLPPGQYLKNCSLQMLDGGGDPIWHYDVYDAWPLKVSPSDLSYSDTDIATISVTLAYARAKERGRG